MKEYLVVLKNGSDFIAKGNDIFSAIQLINDGMFDYSFIKSVTEITNSKKISKYEKNRL